MIKTIMMGVQKVAKSKPFGIVIPNLEFLYVVLHVETGNIKNQWEKNVMTEMLYQTMAAALSALQKQGTAAGKVSRLALKYAEMA